MKEINIIKKSLKEAESIKTPYVKSINDLIEQVPKEEMENLKQMINLDMYPKEIKDMMVNLLKDTDLL